MNRILAISIFIILGISQLWATHNRAGEISYKQTGPLTIEATITTYTKASSTSADRDTLTLFWGDGSSTLLERDNGNGDVIPGDIKINYYSGTHTYASRATYTLSFQDPNRVNNILNVNYPNSVEIPFYLETTFTLLNTQFEGLNNSVTLLQPPLDFACIEQPFIHNPTAFDADGDSISYELIIPLETEGMTVPNYQFPDEIGPSALENIISLDPLTGDFLWDAPKIAGEYNIAIRVNEHRNGTIISSTIRDMQIFVDVCNNQPPIIESIEELCVIAGEKVEITIGIDDLDEDQLVIFSATGGPFFVDSSPAFLTGPNEFTDPAFSNTLHWQTNCSHIRDQYYQVVLRAQDNFGAENQGLTTLKTIRIRVLGPPPLDLLSEKIEEGVRLHWENPYACDLNATEKFIGFSVWRREGSNPTPFGECENGLEGKGYEIVEYLSSEKEDDRYVYIDEAVETSKIYCYRVLAEFAETTDDGIPFNRVASIPSEETCIRLSKDVALMTKVSVRETDITSGIIDVGWLNPTAVDFDTLFNPGPYTFTLERAIPGAAFSAIASWTSDVFSLFTVETFVDENVNTEEAQYLYQLVIADTDLEKTSSIASSIFLNVNPNDKRNILSWDYAVPWQNFLFYIYRETSSPGTFELIDSTTVNTFTDLGLENGEEYCYYVEAFGTYGLDGIPSPLINLSQENCGIPIDLLAPCPPNPTLISICDLLEESPEAEDLFNTLEWTLELVDCPENEDVAAFRIYALSELSGDYEFLVELTADEFSYMDFRDDIVNGCYKISAVDEVGNESLLSEAICAETCAIYELPNTFTPNGDGANDSFVPRKNLFIDAVNFTVYNRWGNLVFKTNDPELNWDGRDLKDAPVDDGTYYYVCDLIQSNDGLEEVVSTLEGYIEVIR